MATMFATMMATLSGGGGAAAAGAAGTAATVGTTAATGGGALSAISTGLTVLGGLSSIAGAAQESAAMKSEALQEEGKATQETIKGQEDAAAALRAMNADQAKIAVAGYSSGIGGAGSVATAQEEAQKIGDQNVNISRENAALQSAARRDQAGQLRAGARGAIFGGITRAVGGVSNLFQRRYARG